MADGISKQEMGELFEKFFGVKPAARLDPKDLDSFVENVQKSTKQLKESLPVSKQLTNTLKGVNQQYVDVTDELEKLEEAIEGAREQAKKTGDYSKAEALIQEKLDKQKAAASTNVKIAMNNLATGMFGILGSVVNAGFDYAKSLQGGADGITTNTQAIVNQYKIMGEAAQTTGTVVSGLGTVASIFGGTIGKVGKLAMVAGEAFGILGTKAADFAGKAAQYLGDELSKTQKAYIATTQSGAMLAGGMTELRQRAADAGLDVTQFAETIKKSTESLQMMGLGMGEGAKRIGGVSKELRNSQLGTQLQKLGYSFEEQGELAAQVMANNNAAGNKRAMSDAEIAKQTADYGKSLKILQDITGEDAKKAMEKARMQAMEADLYAQAMKEGGPEAVKKLQGQLATMPESMKKGYMEFVSTGGKAIADQATNVAITQNPKIMEQYRSQLSDLKNSAVDQSKAMENAGRYTEQTGKYARDNMDQTRQIGMASRLTGDATLGAVSNINNALILSGAKIGEGATDAAKKATEGAAVNTAPLDKAVTDLESETQRTKAALGKELTPAITEFAGQLRGMAKGVKETMEELGIKAPKSTGEKVGGAVGGAAGGIAGGWAGAAGGAALGTAIAGPIGTVVGGIIGGLVGGYGGGKAGESVGEWTGAKFAVGGMVTQPTKALIGEAGPEAIVPLPDGRKIPVELGGMDKMQNMLNKSYGPEMIGNITEKTMAPYQDIIKTMAKASPVGALSAGLFDGLKTIIGEQTNEKQEETMNGLTEKITELIGTLEKHSSTVQETAIKMPKDMLGASDITKTFEEMQNTMRKQLDAHNEMIAHMRDHKDISEKLLRVTQ